MVSTQPLAAALKYAFLRTALRVRVVAPGADILLNSLEPADSNLTANTMTPEHWEKLANAFHDWPFKPDVLEDETYIHDDLIEDLQNTSIASLRELPEDARLLLDEEEDEIRNEIPDVK